MSSPRKFAEKIALLQQKQAEGDAAFNTILYEVEAAKQVRLSSTKGDARKTLSFVCFSSHRALQQADRVSPQKTRTDVPARKHDKVFQVSAVTRELDLIRTFRFYCSN
jgi:hypothetical protein